MKKISLLLIFVILVVFLSGFLITRALDNEKINVLIYGVDGRKNVEEAERSDAIILINLDFYNGSIVATSIPRDSYVKISCRNNKYDKINHAYAYGGEVCLNDTVAQLFNIKNIKNVLLNFEDVIELVDYFGLIELTPNYTFCQLDEVGKNKYCFEKNKKILIDGRQALAYMRNRKSLPRGDISRTQNQRQIVKTLIEKFLSLSLVEKIQFYKYAKKNIKTDVTIRDFNVKKIVGVKQFEIREYTLKGEDYINGSYYYKLDKSYLEKIKKFYI